MQFIFYSIGPDIATINNRTRRNWCILPNSFTKPGKKFVLRRNKVSRGDCTKYHCQISPTKVYLGCQCLYQLTDLSLEFPYLLFKNAWDSDNKPDFRQLRSVLSENLHIFYVNELNFMEMRLFVCVCDCVWGGIFVGYVFVYMWGVGANMNAHKHFS